MKREILAICLLFTAVALSGCVSEQGTGNDIPEDGSDAAGPEEKPGMEIPVGEFYDFNEGIEPVSMFRWEADSAIVYNDKLCFPAKKPAGGGQRIYTTHCFDGKNWEVHNGGGEFNEIYNNRIYGLGCDGLCVFNENFEPEKVVAIENKFGSRLESVKANKGKLYIGTEHNNGTHYVFDGSVLSEFSNPCEYRDEVADYTGLKAMEEYNGKLYASFSGCDEFIFVLEGDAWIPIGKTAHWVIDMEVFDGELVLSDGFGIYSFDGSELKEIRGSLPLDKLRIPHFPELEVHDGKLYFYTSWPCSMMGEDEAQAVVYNGSAWQVPEWNCTLNKIGFLISYKGHLFDAEKNKLHILE